LRRIRSIHSRAADDIQAALGKELEVDFVVAWHSHHSHNVCSIEQTFESEAGDI